MDKAKEENFSTPQDIWTICGPKCGLPWSEFECETNPKQCVVVYKPTNISKSQIQTMEDHQQRHFIQTSKGMKQRMCLTHVNENCFARNGMLIEQDGVPLEFSLDCVIDWVPNNNQEIQSVCAMHQQQPCFAAVNFQLDAKKDETKTMPKLTCATIDMLPTNFTWSDDISNVLFALDHMHVDLDPVVDFAVRQWRLLFAECNGDIDKFLASAIHPLIWNFEEKLLFTRSIKKVWYSFDRTSTQCCIENCVCVSHLFQNQALVAN